jgi:hypothetical protein
MQRIGLIVGIVLGVVCLGIGFWIGGAYPVAHGVPFLTSVFFSLGLLFICVPLFSMYVVPLVLREERQQRWSWRTFVLWSVVAGIVLLGAGILRANLPWWGSQFPTVTILFVLGGLFVLVPIYTLFVRQRSVKEGE